MVSPWKGIVCIVRSHVVIRSETRLPVHFCKKRYSTDTSLYLFFLFFLTAFIAFQMLEIFWTFRPMCCLKHYFKCIYTISLILCHFAVFFKLYLLQWCVRLYSLTQQVVVLPDSLPTGTLQALVVIVTDVQPQDITLPDHSSSECCVSCNKCTHFGSTETLKVTGVHSPCVCVWGVYVCVFGVT